MPSHEEGVLIQRGMNLLARVREIENHMAEQQILLDAFKKQVNFLKRGIDPSKIASMRDVPVGRYGSARADQIDYDVVVTLRDGTERRWRKARGRTPGRH